MGMVTALTQLSRLVVGQDEKSLFIFNFFDFVFPASVLCFICSQSLLRQTRLNIARKMTELWL